MLTTMPGRRTIPLSTATATDKFRSNFARTAMPTYQDDEPALGCSNRGFDVFFDNPVCGNSIMVFNVLILSVTQSVV